MTRVDPVPRNRRPRQRDARRIVTPVRNFSGVKVAACKGKRVHRNEVAVSIDEICLLFDRWKRRLHAQVGALFLLRVELNREPRGSRARRGGRLFGGARRRRRRRSQWCERKGQRDRGKECDGALHDIPIERVLQSLAGKRVSVHRPCRHEQPRNCSRRTPYAGNCASRWRSIPRRTNRGTTH
jgi:hypothetical protein